MGPVSKFSYKYRILRRDRLLSVDGMVPLSKLPFKVRSVTSVRSPRKVGICPLNEF